MTKALSLHDLARYLQQSESHAQVHREAQLRGICFHSTDCTPGSLFAALQGKHHDGHQFIDDALSRKAGAILVSREWWQHHAASYTHVPALVVTDTWESMKALAKQHRDSQALFRIAITGSNGKTTVKEMLYAVLKLHGNSYRTPGNYNTAVALTSAIFDIDDDVRFAIFELGISEKGEMEELSDLACPHLAVITNIGMAHSGMLGGREAIAQEKAKVFSCQHDLQTAIVPECSRSFMDAWIPAEALSHGPRSTPDLKKIRGGSMEFTQGFIETDLDARHDIYNVLIVIRIAQVLGIPFPLIQKGISSFSPLRGRGNIRYGRNIVVEDWYNASPESMMAALSRFSRLESEGRRKIMILGGMEELGSFAPTAHQQIVETVTDMVPDLCLFIGEQYQDFLRDGPSFLYYASDTQELQRYIDHHVKNNDLILIKGSRRFALEGIAEYLLGEGVFHAT